MKIVLLFLASIFVAAADAQVTWTPPVQPVAAKPGVLIADAGTGTNSVNCTLTGVNVPATAVSIACSLAGTPIPAWTLALPSGVNLAAFTYQLNSGLTAVTIMLTLKPNSVSGIDFSATANGGTPVTGTF